MILSYLWLNQNPFIMIISLKLFVFFTLFSLSLMEATPKTYVLVHGAWQGQFVWADVKSKLEAAGNRVLTVELPGHGDDQTPLTAITLDAYRNAVIKVINSQPDKVVLVGHSMGGMVISAVAEKVPDKLDKLVYLAAYLPQNGDDLLSLSKDDSESVTGANFEPAPDFSSATIKSSMIAAVFCADGSQPIKELLVNRHRAEPLGPFNAKVALTQAAFGSVPKYYIETLQDRAVGHKLQQQMIARNGTVKQVYTIDSSHSPFLSRPDEVVRLLTKIN
jgi:pimeloyl-ACP methyl ester carboxylesterase